jgi:3',5'-cyclic AMP phosphodiesterase CpdA
MTEDIVFIHLSDPHILASDDRLFGIAPVEQLRRTLDHLLGLPLAPAFVLITGDLTHDGEEESYRRLRTLLAPLAERGIPLLLGLGNHDRRAQFRRGFLSQATDDDHQYYHTTECGDLRVIVLDSLIPGADGGELGETQLGWLTEQLARPTSRRTLIALHHPVALGGMPPLHNDTLRDAPALAEIVRGHAILGILAGHCHTPSATSFADTIAVTAPAIVFQAIPGIEQFATRPGNGFNLCTVRGDKLLVTTLML